MTNPQTYFIAWHPEYGPFGVPETNLENCRSQAEANCIGRIYEALEFRQIRIIEASKVEEMWKQINDMRPIAEHGFSEDDLNMWKDIESVLFEYLPPAPVEGVKKERNTGCNLCEARREAVKTGQSNYEECLVCGWIGKKTKPVEEKLRATSVKDACIRNGVVPRVDESTKKSLVLRTGSTKIVEEK